MNHHSIQSSDRYLFTVVLGGIGEHSAEWNRRGERRAFTVSTAGKRAEANRGGENNSDFNALHWPYFTVAKRRFPLLNCRNQAISQLCAFSSPFCASMSVMEIFRQLIPRS